MFQLQPVAVLSKPQHFKDMRSVLCVLSIVNGKISRLKSLGY